jgi:serine/threonine protein kinase
MPLIPGTRLGHYEVISALGKGGMGEVYRARDTRLGRDVALKILAAGLAPQLGDAERLGQEARVLASLSHPNIGAIHGFEEGDGVRALILELVEGETLADRLAHGPLRLQEALRVAQQIAAALDAAHERGIVHRDLKPGNVMLRPDGVVKVLDFGLAKLAETASDSSGSDTAATRETNLTRPGIILGSPAYIAPEQIGGAGATKRSDVWAFGAVLYELLTGQHAFPASDVSRVLADIVTREPNWGLLPADTPDSIRRLLRRCLAKDPAERLRDIADAKLEIEDALLSTSTSAAIMPPHPAAGSRSRRTVVVLGGFALVGIGVAATLGAEWIRSAFDDGSTGGNRLPLVIMMDSPHPLRVYDKETLDANGTNADVISDILSDLPIRRQKETIGPGWHRDEEIKSFQPDLIVVHYSGFNAEASPDEPRERLRTLIKFFADTPTKFLIYSRNPEAGVNANLSRLLADVYAQKPQLQQRIRGFGLADHGPPRWINSASGAELKLVVKEMLQLR